MELESNYVYLHDISARLRRLMNRLRFFGVHILTARDAENILKRFSLKALFFRDKNMSLNIV